MPWSVFEALNKGQEGFRDEPEAWKAAFPVHSTKEF